MEHHMKQGQADRLTVLYLGNQDDRAAVPGSPGNENLTCHDHAVLGAAKCRITIRT